MQNKKREPIQCHVISNTHWDREWRYSAQRTKYMLVYMLDMLFDIFDKEPEYKNFHLDSQTLPIQDYLEVRPEMEDTVKRYVQEGKLIIGPWFCLPDEFCVSGESLIRNLLLGHKISRRFGQPAKTGYTPFSWGQISQMPQIYRGFGIDMAMFYRGINDLVAPKSEFIWKGPDGSWLVASRFSKRPRYNITYLVQRPVYWNETNIEGREVSWGNGHGPFRFINAQHYELDYQYIHPEFQYHEEHIAAHAKLAIEEQDKDWSTPHRFWSIGHDSSCPDIREVRMIKDCNMALGDKAHVFQSTITDFQAGIKASVSEDLPVLEGEMRYPFTDGSASPLFGWIISARMSLKQENFCCERDLTTYAEPLAVYASLLGAPYPKSFIDMAYNYLLQNHGHDSIGGCGRDIVEKDVLFRFRQSREISQCVMERAMMDIVGAIDLSNWQKSEMAIVVYNSTPFKRTEVNSAVIEIPLEWNCETFEIVDESGNQLPCHIVDSVSPYYQVVQSPNNVANTFPARRFYVRVEYQNIPGFGYRTFKVKSVKKAKNVQPMTLRSGPQMMENEFLKVEINSNGTVDLTDKKSGRLFRGLNYFKDSSEIGDPWQHKVPPYESVFTTLNEKASITLVAESDLETAYRVEILWKLPEGRSADERRRSDHYNPFKIITIYTLRKGQSWLEVETFVDNTVEDHYLQVCFPSSIQADHIMVQGQFDVIKRPIARLDYSLYQEVPQTEHPMNSFIDINDDKVGLALLNEGLKAYEAQDDPDRTLCLSLIRAFPLRICVTHEMLDYSDQDRGSQCLGEHVFRYAIFPHTGDWQEGEIWKASEQFNSQLHAVQVGPTSHGFLPLIHSFLEIDPEYLHISAVKRAEHDTGWIIRIFNPYTETISARLRLNKGYSPPQTTQSPVERLQSEFALPTGKHLPWSIIQEVTLEEVVVKDMILDKERWLCFDIPPKKIKTFKVLP